MKRTLSLLILLTVALTANAATGPVLQGIRVVRETNGQAQNLLVRGELRLGYSTANRALVTDGNGVAQSSAVTAAELLFISGVTSGIQDQLDARPSNAFLIGVTNDLSGALTARMDAATNALAGFFETRVVLATNLAFSYTRIYVDAATNTIAGYARSYTQTATNDLNTVLRTRMDAGTNDLNTVLRALISSSTNTGASTVYVDNATNALAGVVRAYADTTTNSLSAVLRALITTSTNNNLASANAYSAAATNALSAVLRAYTETATNDLNTVIRALMTTATNNNLTSAQTYANAATNALAGVVTANMGSTSNTLYTLIGTVRPPYVGVASSVINFDTPNLTNTITGSTTYTFANQSDGEEVNLAVFSATAQTVNFPAESDTFAWYGGASPPATLTGTNFFKFRMVGAKVWGAYISQSFIGNRTPSSASDTGKAGDIAWDASFIYVCVADNTWKRVAIATW